MMAKFRHKPVVIEAVQFTGETVLNLLDFMGGHVQWNPIQKVVFIPTLEGEMAASAGDWIIKGIKGEFYPCKPDIFAATYEAAE